MGLGALGNNYNREIHTLVWHATCEDDLHQLVLELNLVLLKVIFYF